MDGASPLNGRMAVIKAYTATKWLHDTKAIKERLFDMGLGDDRRDIAWFGDPRFTAVWGGILLRAPDGTVLGALGESGGTPAEDEEMGQLGAAAFAAVYGQPPITVQSTTTRTAGRRPLGHRR